MYAIAIIRIRKRLFC